MAGKNSVPSARSRSARTKFINVSRVVLFWYTVVTIFLRCPNSPTAVTDASPWMCKPYFETRDKLAPYITPSYDTYAAPYVDAYLTPYYNSYIGPHVQQLLPYANLFQNRVYDPAAKVVKTTYATHAAPRVAQAKDYGDREWDKTVKPHIDDLVERIQGQYQKYLAPYLAKLDVAARPYLERTQSSAIQVYHGRILPAYRKSLPRLQKEVARSKAFTLQVLYPRARWAVQNTAVFITRRIWPSIRILYGQNIEPQVSKIRQRLSSYRDSKKLEAAIEAVDEASRDTTSIAEEMFTSISSMSAAFATGTVDATETTEAPVTTPSEYPSISHASTVDSSEATASPLPPKVTDDLGRWEAKFKLAADRGAEDLAARVLEISNRQIASQVHGVGEALVVQLEESAKDAINEVKSAIIDAVKQTPADASNEDKELTIEGVHWSIRKAGKEVKARAQSLRSWKVKFDEETRALVASASRSTLNVIDGIRDLGLQDIGMRWAGMDNVTYQDWAEYHDLKETFDQWRSQVERVATEHESLSKATQEAEDIEARGMAVAEGAAKELARLKDVTSWKVTAGDSSNDFETRRVPAAAAKLGQKILDKLGVAGVSTETSRGFVESLTSRAAASASSILATAKESFTETAVTSETSEGFVDSFTSRGAASASSILSFTDTSASDAASQATDFISEAVVGTTATGSPVQSGTYLAQDGYSSVGSKIKDFIGGGASVSSLTASASPSSSASSLLDSLSEYIPSPPPASNILSDASEPLLPQSPLSSISSFASDASSSLDATLAHATTKLPDALYSLSSALDDDAVDASSSLADTVSPALPTDIESPVSSLANSIPTTAPSLLPSVTSVVASVAGTVAPSIGEAVSKQGADFVDRAAAFSASVKSRVESALGGGEEEVRSLTSRLVDEL